MEQLQPPIVTVMPSQKEQYKEALLQIKHNVTKDDRKNCAVAVKASMRTINGYVNGHVYDCSTAYKIFTFLKAQIDQRNEPLKAQASTAAASH